MDHIIHSIRNGTFEFPKDYAEMTKLVSKLYESRSVNTVAPTSTVEEWWLYAHQNLGDLNLIVAFYIVMNVCYALGGITFWMIDKSRILHKYKVQEDRYPTTLDYWQCLLNLVQNYVLIIFPLIFVMYPMLALVDGFQMTLPLPSIITWIWQMFFCIIMEDVGQYWFHKWLHTPYLYKKIHKLHHKYSAPFGLAAAYAHPLEVLILAIPTFLGPVILQCHIFVFFSFVLFRQLDAVGTHCGYDLPHLFDPLPYYGGTKMHDFHHKNFIWNYSSRFDFMDRWFGTYKDT